MMEHERIPVYSMAIVARITLQAHSASNSTVNGSTLLPRTQLLADNTRTDAISGNILKHDHAYLLTRYFRKIGVGLCPACEKYDGRRAGALVSDPAYKNLTMQRILSECGLCDIHGFLITAKNAASPEEGEDRGRLNKSTLIDFGDMLGVPGAQAFSEQIATRIGASKEEGQMLMKYFVRSAVYALGVRYEGADVGVDTNTGTLIIKNEAERLLRHQAVLATMRDCLLSPKLAKSATLMPHLTNITGVIVIESQVGRAGIYSALQPDFMDRLKAMQNPTRQILSFETVEDFYALMTRLSENSYPAAP